MTENKIKELQKLLDKFTLEDAALAGLLAYDTETDEILASTYDKRKAKGIIALRKKYSQLGAEAVMEGIYPAGRWNWGLISVARYTLFAVRLAGDYALAGEFLETKKPSACAEDALEFSLMVNEVLTDAHG